MGYTTPLGGLGTLYSGGAFYLSPETGPGGLLLRWADWGFFILWRGGLVDWVDWCGGLGFGGCRIKGVACATGIFHSSLSFSLLPRVK